MQLLLNRQPYSQSGFTLIELMIVIAIIGVLTALATLSYQHQVRKAHIVTIYQTLSQFQVRYQTLIDEGGKVTSFSPNGLNMPVQTKYCKFSVTAPNSNSATLSAVVCRIQNLDYLSNQTITLDLDADGAWQCRASAGISKLYLPKDCR
jgi:type IV pilus assembly protein PilA